MLHAVDGLQAIDAVSAAIVAALDDAGIHGVGAATERAAG